MKIEIQLDEFKAILLARSKSRKPVLGGVNSLLKEQPLFDIPEEYFKKLKHLAGKDKEVVQEMVNYAVEQFITDYEEKKGPIKVK